MRLLEFEQNLVVDTFGESFLLIAAQGLTIERIFFKHLQLYSDPSVLVLVLNTTNVDQEYFLRLFRKEHRQNSTENLRYILPKQFNASVNAEERKSAYLQGGVIFGTTRIFVTDLLKGVIPLDLVTGVLFYRAHGVFRSSLESFIIRSYREAKSGGFVKAFSDNANAFAAAGLGAFQRAVSALRVERVRFLPRYHSDVIAELDKRKPQLYEMAVQLKQSVKIIESYLMELMMACVQELRNCCPGMILDNMNLENALSRGFEKSLQRCLEDDRGSHDRLTPKARDLLTDISRLRQLLTSSENDDAKTFSTLLKTLRSDERGFHNNSGWLFTPSAQKLFDVGLSKRRQDETPAKWDHLISVLTELRAKDSKDPEAAPVENSPDCQLRVIVLAEDERVCSQLAETIITNCQESSDLRVVVGWKAAEWETEHEQNYALLLSLYERYQILTALDALKPSTVILYNVDPWIVRQLEIFEAAKGDDPAQLTVYILMYDNSAEEQRYLTSLKSERDAFDQLFREDAALLIRKADDAEAFQHSQPVIEGNHTIVVDLREFRSELPTFLHTRGVRIAPVTLTIGDYILTPSICVERKNAADLISSLTSGRLYDQCKAMCDHYDRPMVLIELDNANGGRRSWRRLGDGLLGRLVCLTLHFRRIRFLWATSPSAATDLLLDIKWKRDDPDVERAVATGKEDADSGGEDRIKSWAEYLLLCLPDANATNIHQLTKTATSLKSLCQCSKEELSGNLNSKFWGDRLHDFFTRDFRQKQTADESTKGKPKKRR